MTEGVTKDSRFDYGRVISRTMSAIGADLGVYALLTVILLGIPSAVIGGAAYGLYAGGYFTPSAMQGPGAMILLTLPVLYVIVLAAFFGLQAAVIHGTIAHLNGRRPTLGECLASAWRHWFIMLLIGIVTGLGEMAGLLLFIVPGVLMMLAWSVAIPVRIAERKGVFASISRSADLTRGRRGSLLGLYVIYIIANDIIQQIIQSIVGVVTNSAMPAAGADPFAVLWPTMGASLFMTFILSMFSAAGIASVYFELRSIREGVSPADLAAVFD
jgi:hypothetical protein